MFVLCLLCFACLDVDEPCIFSDEDIETLRMQGENGNGYLLWIEAEGFVRLGSGSAGPESSVERFFELCGVSANLGKGRVFSEVTNLVDSLRKISLDECVEWEIYILPLLEPTIMADFETKGLPVRLSTSISISPVRFEVANCLIEEKRTLRLDFLAYN